VVAVGVRLPVLVDEAVAREELLAVL